ncbi:MAG: glycerol-3-phosphate dehydrogenase/oxidase [Spirochaetales bacterium]|nr:glycerol-3-phosphate dehydrogenase/oxidase [Spirochaetales bacterium]
MQRFFESTQTPEPFDLIIVGGGISGAAVAHEATADGLRVALFEKDDFGWATSSATSKLIHGGLRYLKTMEFGLVRESLKERRILEDIAPNLVYPLPFVIPHYRRSEKWMLAAGLTLYDLLGFDRGWTRHKDKRIARHRSLSVAEVRDLAPIIPEAGLVGGSLYYDCQSIFPERLTLAFLKSAAAGGAVLANRAPVIDFLNDGKRISGVRVRDLLTGSEHEVRARLVVNTGGPWADRLLSLARKDNDGPGRLRMSEGIHIIVPGLLKEHALVLLTPEGRHFFVLPWRGHSLIGTTDRPYEGNPDDYQVSRQSIEHFLREINASLSTEPIDYKDIVFAYGGLRPLTDTQTESTYSSSRRYEIFDSADQGLEGLLTVEGGKYTTSRNLAAKVLEQVAKKLGRKPTRSSSALLPLFGCDIDDLENFVSNLARTHPDLDARTVRYLGRNYGSETHGVLDCAIGRPDLLKAKNDDGEILAQVLYAVRSEMASDLEDILLRRTGFGTLGCPPDSVLEEIAKTAGEELRWTDTDRKAQVRRAKEILAVPE